MDQGILSSEAQVTSTQMEMFSSVSSKYCRHLRGKSALFLHLIRGLPFTLPSTCPPPCTPHQVPPAPHVPHLSFLLCCVVKNLEFPVDDHCNGA